MTSTDMPSKKKETGQAQQDIPSPLDGVRMWYLLGSVAWQVIIPAGVALAIGLYVDSLLGTRPWIGVGMTLLSPIASFFLIRGTVRKVTRDAKYTPSE